MVDKKEKMIYYVSNLGISTVSIIDGDGYHIIKEVEIGPRPQNIIVDESNNIYIASDRNGKVTVIHDLYDCIKTWDMPNNGNIQVDSIAHKIYVCNTDEVCIYDLRTGEKIGSLRGFIAADSIELNKNKKRLFVLDVLQNEIKVYDTSNLNLIKIYKDIGNSPKYILIEENENYIYIANREKIYILNIENENISFIDLEKRSIITSLEQSGTFLYVANDGLHRIEVIDTLKRKCIANITTTMQKVKRIRLSPDKKILLVIGQNIEGKGVINRIDVSGNVILDTFDLEKKNGIPYDIGVAIQRRLPKKEEALSIIDSEDTLKKENGTTILAKKVLSTYQEKIIFQDVSIKLTSEEEEIINIDEIRFKKCEIINETRNREIIDNRKEYSMLKYNFYIPYYIWYKDEHGRKYIDEGKIEGIQNATLYIPAYEEQQGVEFVVNSFTKLTSNPEIINNDLKFSVSVLISTRAIVDELVFIPFFKNCDVQACENK
ncbi:hypothetical protein CLOBY_40790 [Clostridium saccharobutylicum]|uniref:YncE family protein n=1 Tax=Clostridium saccharobutylicum TaxID=169679 RepID=UPI000983BC50|nr:hypothetical protein [Clostridium saccharobutylicum]AQS11921.1 hypothetical protein CLOBY_40790 [Clostridium saccharobutylicum]MBC2435619.1 hypothetical protein [Clostridium saccharobutylicum]NSB87027.1 hypothetical protein [Clostridium saccharobutylicum]NYC30068.1 hypothetical protein [Clostridium saccharobutylicum]OOM18737.1 hypothetical protein CLSAB_05060 [Clostridium saccharobutylicum]